MSSREAQHPEQPAPRIGGFVLAGGQSSRMGTDKAMLPLAGRPLVAHALAKLAPIAATTAILAGAAPGNPELARFAPVLFDLHPNCGPLGGIEAALTVSAHPWNLILPVDVPFVPRGLLAWWAERILADPGSPVRIALFRAGDRVQPAVLLLHRDALPFISRAIRDGDYKLLRVLESAAGSLSGTGDQGSAQPSPALEVTPVPSVMGCDPASRPPELFARLRPADLAVESLWFANLNNRQEFTQAEQRMAELPDLL